MILITGATGFLGKSILKELENTSIKFKCFVYEKEKQDLLYPETIEKAIKGCNTILHAANIIQGPDVRRVNEQGTKNLINACKKHKIKKFIYISSTAVIDGDENKYTTSKINCENLVKQSGLNYIIIRPTIMIGKDNPANYGILEKQIKQSRFWFLRKEGKCLIQPVWVKDVAKGIIQCIKLNKFKNQIYTFAAEKPIKYNDFLRLLNQKLNYPAKMIYLSYLLTEPKAKIIDIIKRRKRITQKDRTYNLDKEKKELNYQPKSIKEVIASY